MIEDNISAIVHFLERGQKPPHKGEFNLCIKMSRLIEGPLRIVPDPSKNKIIIYTDSSSGPGSHSLDSVGWPKGTTRPTSPIGSDHKIRCSVVKFDNKYEIDLSSFNFIRSSNNPPVDPTSFNDNSENYPISKSQLREWALEIWRQTERCAICNRRLLRDSIHACHIIPLAIGGRDERCNIVPGHKQCNLEQGVRHMHEIVREKAEEQLAIDHGGKRR